MTQIRSMTAAAFAGALALLASSSVLANSEMNETREARRAYCQNDVPDFMKGQCMKQTAQTLQRYDAEYRECLRDPNILRSTCDTQLSNKLGTLNTGTN